jgi:uncharacterized protein
MRLSYRLTMMFVSLVIILSVGWLSMHSLEFATGQFWFISGALLLIMLSLVDQPHFSKDANVFVNGATALVSLFTILESQRAGIWWIFCSWAIFLIVASFVLMALRSRELFLETKPIQFVSRVNRAIGRPESIFSAFFLWGVFLQFTYPKDGVTINSLLLFWAVFMILNVPGIAHTVSALFAKSSEATAYAGIITGIQSPRLAVVKLSPHLPDGIIGKKVLLTLDGEEQVAEGTLFEDRVVAGLRLGRIALTSFGAKWTAVSAGGRIEITLPNLPVSATRTIGVASAGSSIGRLVFEVDPRMLLHAGEVVKVQAGSAETYYQIVSATIEQTGLEEGNASQSVRVAAGQLGCWDAARATFAPIDWVAPAGELIAVSSGEGIADTPPAGRCLVGHVPNSTFPVHVHVSDTITHNTALIGVTGSGKSYLAFHLIEAYLDAGIKVLVLDLTRQHWPFLLHRNPTALTGAAGVNAWLASDSPLAIHQFAAAPAGFPAATADFAQNCFEWLKANTQLQPGVDVPARLCIVIEEAHSLIPEWNQVAQQADTQQVNRAARVILQGRKFGLGTLLITQRTANVTKTVLNQCNTIFAMRSFDQTGLDFLRNYMGEEYSQAISTLPDRTAILVGKASSSARPIILKVSDFGTRWAANQQPAAPTSPGGVV